MVKSILGQCNEFNCLSAIVVILVVEVFILLITQVVKSKVGPCHISGCGAILIKQVII